MVSQNVLMVELMSVLAQKNVCNGCNYNDTRQQLALEANGMHRCRASVELGGFPRETVTP